MYTCKALVILERRGQKLRVVAFDTLGEDPPEKPKKLSAWTAEGWFLGSETRSLVNFDGQLIVVMTKIIKDDGSTGTPDDTSPES